MLGGETVCTFTNVPSLCQRTLDIDTPGLKDHSDFVFESLESNRIYGATVASKGANAVLQNAADLPVSYPPMI